jgi:protein TonB
VLEVDPLAGPDPLISSAVDAVRQWKYRPTLLNGRSVEVETTVDVPFPAGFLPLGRENARC